MLAASETRCVGPVAVNTLTLAEAVDLETERPSPNLCMDLFACEDRRVVVLRVLCVLVYYRGCYGSKGAPHCRWRWRRSKPLTSNTGRLFC